MAFNSFTDTVIGSLGKIGDLHELKNDNAVLNFSIAVTPRKKVNGNWEDDETIWTNCAIWGRDARAMAASQLAPGTQVVVQGTRRAVKRDAYTNNNGQEIPARIEQELNVNFISVAINPFVIINVQKIKNNPNGAPTQASTSAPAQQAPAQAPAQQNTASQIPESGNTDSQIPDDSDDPFANSDSGDDGDPFSNIDF